MGGGKSDEQDLTPADAAALYRKEISEIRDAPSGARSHKVANIRKKRKKWRWKNKVAKLKNEIQEMKAYLWFYEKMDPY